MNFQPASQALRLFNLIGPQYEDNRISWADWEQNKPFAELPALEVFGQTNNQTIVQPLAIARFIAERHGLAGKDDMEAGKAYLIVNGCLDFIEKGEGPSI